MRIVLLWLALVPLLVAGDLLWLGVIMKDFYRSHMGHLLSNEIKWVPALFFYAIYTAGLLYFAILPGITSGNLLKTVVLAALLGGFAYATYDLTNHATLREWPLLVTVVDIAWGVVLSGLLGAIGFFVGRSLLHI
jgi:uncharacterized membrane protein